MRAVQADAPAALLGALTLRWLLDGAQVGATDFRHGNDAGRRNRAWWRQRYGVALVKSRRHVGLRFPVRQAQGMVHRLVQACRPSEIRHLRAGGDPHWVSAFAAMTKAVPR